MNQNIRRKYFEMQGKVIFPEDKGNEHKQLAATVAANFASIGYPMTTEQIKKLAKADADEIVVFYKENYKMFSDILGADKNQKPFYPDFPTGCMKRDNVDYFIDQIIYGLSGLMIEPSVYMHEKEVFPFIGTPMHRVIMEGSIDDLYHTFELAVQSPIAYSKTQREFIIEYVKDNKDALQVVIDNTSTKNRENAVTCAMMVEELSGNDLHTAAFMKQPADLLRYAAFKSVVKENIERDPYLAIPLRDNPKDMPKFTIGRKERAFIMNMLADMAHDDGERLSNKMSGHDAEWKRLFKRLHITDKAWSKPKYAPVKRAIIIIQSGEKLDRPARRIEEAIKNNDLETAVRETQKMPGEFMRRFDKMYRMALEQDKSKVLLDALKGVSERAGIATVTGTIGNIECRGTEEETRYFKAKTGKVYQTSDKNRKAFTEEQVKAVVDIAMAGMAERFKGKTPMGNVYISDTLADVKIPADIRDSSGALGSLTSGSKMPIPEDWELMRFFVGWTNMKRNMKSDDQEYEYGKRIDIDLSVTFCDNDMNRVDFCGWDGNKRGDGYVYSGDVQDGGPCNKDGRAEFVDIDIKAMKAKGVKYIIPQVNSYTGQKFSVQPNTTFGVMKRTNMDMGKNYEPATVMNRFVLDVEDTMVVPYIIDIQNMEIMWVNASSENQAASRSFRDIQRQVGKASTSKTMSLDRLVEANVIANGTKTEEPGNADMLFVRDTDEMAALKEEFGIKDDGKFILSNNMEYITGHLMTEAHT